MDLPFAVVPLLSLPRVCDDIHDSKALGLGIA